MCGTDLIGAVAVLILTVSVAVALCAIAYRVVTDR